MKITVVTPNFNGGRFLEATLRSVISQRSSAFQLEYILVDGGSRDNSMQVIERYRRDIDVLIVEPDRGPADAINKGLLRATGDIVGWLNADDLLYPGALERVAEAMACHPERALCFGHAVIVDEGEREIRSGITRFKEMFFPISSRFAIQCINYVSQPATFFRRSAVERAGRLRQDLQAAWDYDFVLRLWRHGGAARIGKPPLAAFRWHEASISGRHFRKQFREDWEVAARDAGRFSLQSLLHLGVWWGIVGAYSWMAWRRKRIADRGTRPPGKGEAAPAERAGDPG